MNILLQLVVDICLRNVNYLSESNTVGRERRAMHQIEHLTNAVHHVVKQLGNGSTVYDVTATGLTAKCWLFPFDETTFGSKGIFLENIDQKGVTRGMKQGSFYILRCCKK